MTGAIREYTPYFDFEIPHFDFPGWHTYYDRNIKSIDAILYLMTGSSALVGAWRNNQLYHVGDVAIDIEEAKAFECVVEHTSLNVPNTFSQDRAANPNNWVEISNIRTSMVATSLTSVNIGQGLKTFETQSGKLFMPGTKIIVNSDANPVNDYMWGAVYSYEGSTLVVEVVSVGGIGTHSDWTIMVSGERGERGTTGTPGIIAEAPMTGSVYGRNGAEASWEVVDAQNADTISNTPAGNIQATSIQGAINELDAEKLAKTGGTLTGTLVINKDGEGLRLNKEATNTYNYVLATAKGNNRWAIVPGNETIELGSNGGSDFDIRRYDDNGLLLGIPLAINRANGQVNFEYHVAVGNTTYTGALHSYGAGYFGGTITVNPSLQFGLNALVGVVGDGTSVGLRAYGNNTVYIQSGGGAANYATFTPTGLTVTNGIVATGSLSAGTTFFCGGDAQLSGSKTEVNVLKAYQDISTTSHIVAGTHIAAGSYLQAGFYVVAGTSVVSAGGSMECRALSAGDAGYVLEDHTQAHKGSFWWQRSTGNITITNDTTPVSFILRTDATIELARGFRGRQGVSGTAWGNVHNFWWTDKVEAWVDGSKVGVIPSPSELMDLTERLENALARIEALEARLATR